MIPLILTPYAVYEHALLSNKLTSSELICCPV